MMLNNFIVDFFLVSRAVFEIRTLTPNSSTRRNCKQFFLCVARGNSTILKPGAGLSIGCLRRAPRGLDKLGLTRFSGYKFRSSSAKKACRSSVPRA
ncbi:hypothetical protein TNCV_2905101 [Trichonephila clavipes]|nr:hypothetical protein TNCV_2905101 [Trichonephila clavipes]